METAMTETRSVPVPLGQACILPGGAELAGEDTLLLGLLASGLMIGAVARRMHLSERTVRRRLRSLCDQLDVATPVEAVVWAVRAGVL
jgi:DNA-binding NarL/FixJ family response regulator